MSKFTPGTTKISNETLANLLLCSFRYSLGRMTYVTGSCREWLETYWQLLPHGWQEQIHRDIDHAIERGAAGHACDVEQWRKVRALPVKEEA